jgi:hypothetical protein
MDPANLARINLLLYGVKDMEFGLFHCAPLVLCIDPVGGLR